MKEEEQKKKSAESCYGGECLQHSGIRKEPSMSETEIRLYEIIKKLTDDEFRELIELKKKEMDGNRAGT